MVVSMSDADLAFLRLGRTEDEVVDLLRKAEETGTQRVQYLTLSPFYLLFLLSFRPSPSARCLPLTRRSATELYCL